MSDEQQYPARPRRDGTKGKPEGEPTILDLLAMQGIEDLEFDIPVMSEFFRPAEFF